jgi:hypothetical protein
MAKAKCPYCGHENIMGADLCEKCLHSLTQKDAPQPGKDKMQRVIMTERVADFISKVPPIMVSPSTSMQEVVDKMHEFPKKGCVLICDEKKTPRRHRLGARYPPARRRRHKRPQGLPRFAGHDEEPRIFG